MPNGPRALIDNACYHVTARGNRKYRVFHCDEDYETYLSLLKHYKREYKFKLYGHCLMPNHVHFVIEIEKSKELSKIMSSLQRAYTAHFNNRYDLVGHLWQGRFKSKIISKDRYLIDCITYIELNPVRAGLVNSPAEYKWSSYRARVLNKQDDLLDELHIV